MHDRNGISYIDTPPPASQYLVIYPAWQLDLPSAWQWPPATTGWLRKMFSRFHHCTLTNLYGPTVTWHCRHASLGRGTATKGLVMYDTCFPLQYDYISIRCLYSCFNNTNENDTSHVSSNTALYIRWRYHMPFEWRSSWSSCNVDRTAVFRTTAVLHEHFWMLAIQHQYLVNNKKQVIRWFMHEIHGLSHVACAPNPGQFAGSKPFVDRWFCSNNGSWSCSQ